MFSFRRDKTGFFVTIILIVIVTGTAISTLVLLIAGIAQGNWEEYLLSVKWILGSAWVAFIITVLIRLRIYKWQHDRAMERRKEESETTAGDRTTDASGSRE
jgi:hypothetical protein